MLGFETFVSPDGLHMNDWSYACMAKGLGLDIADAAERPAMAATAMSHLVPFDCDVRFTPESRHSFRQSECPLSARSRHCAYRVRINSFRN
jgi:hypothetical protein